jgi:hypothetical protein
MDGQFGYRHLFLRDVLLKGILSHSGCTDNRHCLFSSVMDETRSA